MTYPPYGDSPGRAQGQDPTPGYTDYSAQAGFGQGTYGAQSMFPAQGGQYGGQHGGGSPRPGPPSNVGWAVASILFFWPLSFVAMTRALDVYPLWAAGHQAEAEAASASAKKLGMISIAVLAVLAVLYFVGILFMVGLAASGY